MDRIRRVALAVAILAAVPSARAKEDKWVEARSAHFIVVSNAGASQARDTAIQFEQIRELFQQSFVFVKDHPSPVITILAAKDENTLRSLLPEYWGKKGNVHPAGIFLDSAYQLSVAVQLSGAGDNPYEAIYHEYYHSLTIPFFPGLPTWVSEGTADFYGNSKIEGMDATLGMPDYGLIELLHQQPLIPLATLFRVDHASPYYNENSKASIFYAESWALIHYLMIGDNGAHRQQLITYLDRLSQGDTQDEASAKAFGDLGKLQKALQGYAGNTSYFQMKTAAPAKITGGDVKIRALSDAEEEAYRGGFLSLHRQFSAAEPLLQNATILDPELALAQQNLAVFYYLQEKSAEARAALDAAIKLDPKNALTRFLRAYLDSKRSLSDAVDSAAEADLRTAIAANPNFAPAYGLLATRMGAGGQDLPEALELARKGALLEPGNTSYQLTYAEVLARMRKYDDAAKIAANIAVKAPDPQSKTNARQFLEYLQQIKNAEARNGQFRSGGPSTDVAVSKSSNSPEPDSADDDDEEAPEKPGVNDGKLRVDGTVADVQCKTQDMVITVVTADGPVKLHALDNTKVDYVSDVPLKSEEFWPCTSLKGHVVKAKYLPEPTKGTPPYQGELASVEIRK